MNPFRNTSKRQSLIFIVLFAIVGLIALRLTSAQTPVVVSGTVTICDSRSDPSKRCTAVPYANAEVFAMPQAAGSTGVATKAISNGAGSFSVVLAPGTYDIGVEQKESPSNIYCPPQTVEVKTDSTQKIVIDCLAQAGQVL